LKAQDRSEESSSPSGKVVDAIRNGIMSARYVPGQKLIETELAKSYKVSRSSVREALKRLEADGLVRISRNRGASIRSLTMQETMDILDIHLVITPFLTKLAAEAIAKHRNPESLRAVNALLEKFAAHNGGSLEYLGLRQQFYDILIGISGNSHIKSVVPVMLIGLLRLQFHPFMSIERQGIIKMDQQILQAVLAGNKRTAEGLMKRYIKRMRQSFAALPAEAFTGNNAGR
jgi:DNA-binding GntR family transcriptional regulator